MTKEGTSSITNKKKSRWLIADVFPATWFLPGTDLKKVSDTSFGNLERYAACPAYAASNAGNTMLEKLICE